MNFQIFRKKFLKNFSFTRIFQNYCNLLQPPCSLSHSSSDSRPTHRVAFRLARCFLDCGCKGSDFFQTSKSFSKNFSDTFCTIFCTLHSISNLAILCAKFLNIRLTLYLWSTVYRQPSNDNSLTHSLPLRVLPLT